MASIPNDGAIHVLDLANTVMDTPSTRRRIGRIWIALEPLPIIPILLFLKSYLLSQDTISSSVRFHHHRSHHPLEPSKDSRGVPIARMEKLALELVQAGYFRPRDVVQLAPSAYEDVCFLSERLPGLQPDDLDDPVAGGSSVGQHWLGSRARRSHTGQPTYHFRLAASHTHSFTSCAVLINLVAPNRSATSWRYFWIS